MKKLLIIAGLILLAYWILRKKSDQATVIPGSDSTTANEGKVYVIDYNPNGNPTYNGNPVKPPVYVGNTGYLGPPIQQNPANDPQVIASNAVSPNITSGTADVSPYLKRTSLSIKR